MLSEFAGLALIRPVPDRADFIEIEKAFASPAEPRFIVPNDIWIEDEQGQLWLQWPPELLPIGGSPGHTETCLVIEGMHRGCVYFMQTIPRFGQNFYHVANSFDEFMTIAYSDI